VVLFSNLNESFFYNINFSEAIFFYSGFYGSKMVNVNMSYSRVEQECDFSYIDYENVNTDDIYVAPPYLYGDRFRINMFNV
jgi:uncharacterized protein YjbI with pentapeptide repeats